MKVCRTKNFLNFTFFKDKNKCTDNVASSPKLIAKTYGKDTTKKPAIVIPITTPKSKVNMAVFTNFT